VIEPEHLRALWVENQATIAEAEATGSRSTAAAYATQQATIERIAGRPGIDWASEPITIAGLPFQNCPVEGCDIMTDHRACPVHEGGKQ